MSKVKFESTITLGTVIQIVLIIGSLVSAWHKMDIVLVDHEARLKSLERGVFGQYNNKEDNRKPNLQYESARKPGS